MLENRICTANKLEKWVVESQNSIQTRLSKGIIGQKLSAEGDKQQGDSMVRYKLNQKSIMSGYGM